MSIYGKILFDHLSFQDLISPNASSDTRNTLADLFLDDGPLKDEFDTINDKLDTEIETVNNELSTKVDKVEGARLITQAEADKLANLEGQIKTDINNILVDGYEIKGSAEQALIDAKAYADGLAGNYDSKGSAALAQSAAAADATSKANTAEANAKAYADDIKTALLGDDLTSTFDTLKAVQDWVDEHGEVAADLSEKLSAEVKKRETDDKALSDRIKAYEDVKDTYATLNKLNQAIATAQRDAEATASKDAAAKVEVALKTANQYTTTKINEASQLSQNYTNQKVEQLEAKTQVKVNEINSSINQEAKTRAEEDSKLSQQIKKVSDLANETNTSLNNLLENAGEIEDVKEFLDSLATQLGDNSIAILFARIEQLEKILYSENLIIGEVDSSTFSPISPTNELVYDGGLVNGNNDNYS